MFTDGLPRETRTLLIDVLWAVLAGVVLALPMLATTHESAVAAVLWSLLMISALAVRRRYPLVAVGIAAAAGLGMYLAHFTPLPALIVIPIVVYSVARYHRASTAAWVTILGAGGSIMGPTLWATELPEGMRALSTIVLVALCSSLVALAYLLGRYVRERQVTAALDQEIAIERFAAAQRQSAQESELAVGRARNEVAQELHDVLAHSLSVIVVQAEGAKALMVKKPDVAGEALDVIARTGRTSIQEIRRIVAVLRQEEAEAQFGPAPSLGQIPAMIATAGDRIDVVMPDETPVVPDSVGLTAFRVVQESVTNFLKHAGPTAHARVEIDFTPSGVELLITDDGLGAQSKSDGRGAGLRGMRERVAAMGGTLEAGPRHGGGFEVRATLPTPNRLGRGWLE
ncbi:MAG TPA: histidine kinase [Arachnia sp.]|nr:histidine kinase [Arachnia sp.]HMT85995.1 histidine kinase [Arachnia sp.]